MPRRSLVIVQCSQEELYTGNRGNATRKNTVSLQASPFHRNFPLRGVSPTSTRQPETSCRPECGNTSGYGPAASTLAVLGDQRRQLLLHGGGGRPAGLGRLGAGHRLGSGRLARCSLAGLALAPATPPRLALAGGAPGLARRRASLAAPFGLEALQLLSGVLGGLGIHLAGGLAVQVDPLGPFAHRLEIAGQVDVAGERPAHQLLGPGLLLGQGLVDPYLERAGVALEEGAGVALVPLGEQRLGGGGVGGRSGVGGSRGIVGAGFIRRFGIGVGTGGGGLRGVVGAGFIRRFRIGAGSTGGGGLGGVVGAGFIRRRGIGAGVGGLRRSPDKSGSYIGGGGGSSGGGSRGVGGGRRGIVGAGFIRGPTHRRFGIGVGGLR